MDWAPRIKAHIHKNVGFTSEREEGEIDFQTFSSKLLDRLSAALGDSSLI